MFTTVTYSMIFALSINFCFGKKYTNYTLYRAIPVNESHMEFFRTLNERYDVNFWREPAPGMLFRAIDFVISPDDQQFFHEDAEAHGIYLTTIIEDVQRAFDQQTVKSYVRRQMNTMNWNSYFRLDDIYNWLQDLSKAYPQEVELHSIGNSYEDRNIIVVKVVLAGSQVRSTVIVEGGIHAREWIAPAVVTYMIHSIIHAPNSGDENLKNVAHTYEWYFVPVLNPDGYEYSHTHDRLWRKNRNGPGIDLNRNFGYAFGTVGANRQRTSESYCGTHPFSEKESKAIAQFVKTKSQHLEYYISFHSYGQYMMIPYANSTKHLDNYDEMHKMCRQAANRLARKYKTVYDIGTPYETVGYMASGVSTCWVKRGFKVPYVVTFELRDNGYFGFALPPEKILPTCEETMDGLISLLTPRNINRTTLQRFHHSGQSYKISDQIVIIFNVLLFIIVRFG